MGKPRDLANVVATGNILADGAVAPAELTGVTSTAAEINILDGVTATAAELNLMDGVTATTAELNHVDGVTSNVQTQIDTKAPVASPTFTGTATAPTVNASTALQIGGVAVTATAAELNIMDGVTASASDINGVAGINSNVQTQLNLKAPIDGPTFTGDVTLPDKIVHTGDTNTAIRFPAADTVSFETSGSERFRVASAGQLGIGGATYGTSGQVLTSGGASAAPTWADAGGGAYELIQKTSISSNVTSVTYNSITAAEGQLIILLNNLEVNANGRLELYFKDASGNNLNSNGTHEYDYATHKIDTGGSHSFQSVNHYAFQINGSNYDKDESINGQINIYGWGTANPFIYSNLSFRNSANDIANHYNVSKFNTNGSSPVPTSIVLDPTGEPSSSPGNPSSITTGDIYLYKLV